MDKIDLLLKLGQVTPSSELYKDQAHLSSLASLVVDRFSSSTLELYPSLLVDICSLIESAELDVADLVKAIKCKIARVGADEGREARMVLSLLDLCTKHDRGFEEIASEKVLEVVVDKLIDNPQFDRETRFVAMKQVMDWARNEKLGDLAVSRRTYLMLKGKSKKAESKQASMSYEVTEGSASNHNHWGEPRTNMMLPIESSSHIPEWVYLRTSKPENYRTEWCRYGMNCSHCNCLYAHSVDEKREKDHHPKYKTVACLNFRHNLPCPYHEKGRCSFLHVNPEDYQAKKNH